MYKGVWPGRALMKGLYDAFAVYHLESKEHGTLA
jgi:hypothetical protein